MTGRGPDTSPSLREAPLPSLLVVQFDEDDGTSGNHIVTIFVGPMVKPGKYSEKINHYNVLGTIEDMCGLRQLGKTSTAKAHHGCGVPHFSRSLREVGPFLCSGPLCVK
jgi:hypothetical protein